MFEQMGDKHFLNREHTGDYVEVSFDTYIDNRGKEEVLDVTLPIHYYEAGRGDALILVHGIGQSSYTWRKNFEELSKSFHVYAIDLPGHGFSGRPEIGYSIEEFALAIEAFMNAKKIISAHFCVFGDSVAYVLDFAIHNQQRTKGLVLISPVLLGGGKGNKGRASVFGNAASRMMINVQSVRNLLEECYFDRTLVTEEVAQEYYNGMGDRDYKAIARMCLANYYDEDVIRKVGHINSPMLAVAATDDKISGGKNSEFFALGLDRGNLLEIRNCGYIIQEEKYDRFNQAVKVFLRGR